MVPTDKAPVPAPGYSTYGCQRASKDGPLRGESMDEDSIDYLDEPEDDDEDPKEDPEEDHTDYPIDGRDGDDEPFNDDDNDDDTNYEDEEPTEGEDDDEEEEEHLAPVDSSAVPIVDPVTSARDTKAFKTDESAPTPRLPQTRVPFSQTRLRRVRKTVRLEPPMSASMEARISEHPVAPTPPPPKHHGARISVRPHTPMTASTQAHIDAFTTISPPFPLPPTSPAYDQAPLGHRTSMIRLRDDIPEEDMPPQRKFVLTAPSPGPGHDARTIARATEKVEDVGYVRALQASKHMMMISIKEVKLRVSYQAHVRRRESEDFYTSLHDAQTDRRDIRLEIDVRQRAEDLAPRQMMHTHVLNARAQIDTMEDTGSSWTLKKKLTNKYCSKGEIKKLEIELWNLKVGGDDVAAYTHRFQELALMCIKFLADETKNIDNYIGGLPNKIYGNVMSARPKTLDDAIELANDLMYQKLRTYVKKQNDNKRKADDSSRNN
nr:reverse transcriptase domain-containing protein [Tanacetum cinerariifolium]